jgi:hypothetical protein
MEIDHFQTKQEIFFFTDSISVGRFVIWPDKIFVVPLYVALNCIIIAKKVLKIIQYEICNIIDFDNLRNMTDCTISIHPIPPNTTADSLKILLK